MKKRLKIAIVCTMLGLALFSLCITPIVLEYFNEKATMTEQIETWSQAIASMTVSLMALVSFYQVSEYHFETDQREKIQAEQRVDDKNRELILATCPCLSFFQYEAQIGPTIAEYEDEGDNGPVCFESSIKNPLKGDSFCRLSFKFIFNSNDKANIKRVVINKSEINMFEGKPPILGHFIGKFDFKGRQSEEGSSNVEWDPKGRCSFLLTYYFSKDQFDLIESSFTKLKQENCIMGFSLQYYAINLFGVSCHGCAKFSISYEKNNDTFTDAGLHMSWVDDVRAGNTIY